MLSFCLARSYGNVLHAAQATVTLCVQPHCHVCQILLFYFFFNIALATDIYSLWLMQSSFPLVCDDLCTLEVGNVI